MSPVAVGFKLRQFKFQIAKEKKRKVKLIAETHPPVQTPNIPSKQEEEEENKCLKEIGH